MAPLHSHAAKRAPYSQLTALDECTADQIRLESSFKSQLNRPHKEQNEVCSNIWASSWERTVTKTEFSFVLHEGHIYPMIEVTDVTCPECVELLNYKLIDQRIWFKIT